MNYAKLESSPRLQSVLSYLRECGTRGATSWQVMQACRCVDSHTGVSELRRNGFEITCKRERDSENGRAVYRYTLIEHRADAQGQYALL